MQNRFQKPYPMSRISYPTSGLELETWVEQTIQREIARGRILQDQKSLQLELSNNVAVLVPKVAKGNCDRRTISKWNRGQARSKSPLRKNGRMRSSVSRDDSCSSYRSPLLGRPVCSMRISELAAPTKRQCMAAWRANANVLPETMISRLKQRVMDQEPIVKVSDTINCWKHNRRSSDSRNSVVITPSKRPSRKINKDAMNQKIQAENKAISDKFGVKIAELLMKPIAITLNSQLKNISNIISDEMYNIVKDTKIFKEDKATSKRMIQETSEKVTIWIAKILEDSSEKLLEEDLRARAILPAGDNLLTLIEIITYQERDLEEQEGPVLDVLDELVDSILHKCIKTPSDVLTPEYLSVTSEHVDKNDQQDTDLQTADEGASQGDVTLDEEANKDNIEDDITKQLNKVIDSVTKKDDLESASKVSNDRGISNEEKYDQSNIKPDLESETSNNSNSNIKPKSDIAVLYSNDTPLEMPEDDIDDEHNQTTNENISGAPELSSTQLPSNEITEPLMDVSKDDSEIVEDNILAPGDNNVTDTNDDKTSNVSDALEMVTEDLTEGKNKTVKFSNENLEPLNNNYNEQNQLNRKHFHLEDDQHLENIAYFDRLDIDFAPPNEDLLSDADESWPNTLPMTKPSASATRSITSMGNIIETDELFSTALEDATEYLLKTTDSKKDHEDDNDEKVPQSKLGSESAGDLKDSYNTFENTTQYLLKNMDSKRNREDENDKTIPQSILSPELAGDLKENDNFDLGLTNNLQQSFTDISKDLPHVNEKGEALHEALTKPKIENPSSIFLLDPTQADSITTVTSTHKAASIILIGDEYLQESQINDGIIRESDISKEKSTTNGAATRVNVGPNVEESISQKFDYRVHLKTAPAWIRRGQGEPNGISCACRPFNLAAGTDKMKEREGEILKWCQDLDFILMNLDKWKTWLNYISKYITDLKRKAGKANRSRQRSPLRTEEDIPWRRLHKRAMGGLEMRRKDETVNVKIPLAPLKYCRNCGRRKSNQSKKRHHQTNFRNNVESKCKRHHRRDEAYIRKNLSFKQN